MKPVNLLPDILTVPWRSLKCANASPVQVKTSPRHNYTTAIGTIMANSHGSGSFVASLFHRHGPQYDPVSYCSWSVLAVEHVEVQSPASGRDASGTGS